jgi:hypothetical protein
MISFAYLDLVRHFLRATDDRGKLPEPRQPTPKYRVRNWSPVIIFLVRHWRLGDCIS